ncbi:MAG TPA: hypothetical protein VJ727_06790 [Rhodanobacteraceae bacterium]|nr:hypothetical protein [Rhodanobacteraceae bacterium]
MKPTNAKPHAGGRGASDGASARESVSGSDHTAQGALINQAVTALPARAIFAASRRRRKAKSRMEIGTYFALPHAVMNSPNFRALSAHAVKLLTDLGGQYHGYNNGDLCAAWRIMHARGWKSRDTLARALSELLHFGMIEKTRQGGLNRCGLYALTWHAIDECRGKLECVATRVPSGLWKEPKPSMPKRTRKKQNAGTAGVSRRHGRRDSERRVIHLPTRRAG